MALDDNPLKNDAGMPALSVCICVEGSGQDIRKALSSVKDIASEVVLVESRATDKTAKTGSDIPPLTEIAREINAGYYCKDFGEDLSGFRNAAMRAAENDFVLFIDADEEFVKEDKEKIEHFLQAKHYDVFYTKILNLDTNGDIVSFYYRPRLFRKVPGFHFAGEFVPRLIHNGKEKFTNISFIHHGYALSKDKLAMKDFVNQKLFKLQIKREPDNPFCYFYAAESSEIISDFDAAREKLAKAIKIINGAEKMTPEFKALLAESHNALARIALNSKNVDEALKTANEGYELAKNNININFMLGEAYFAKKDYESAFRHYSSYMELHEMFEEVDVKNTFMVVDSPQYAEFMIGKTLMNLGKPDDALPHFTRALELKPEHAKTLNELGCLYQMKDDISKAKEYFMKANEADPDLAEAVCNLGVVSFTDEPEKGLELLKKAADMQPDNRRIQDIYKNYDANKERIIEKRRISVLIDTYDFSKIKETVKSALKIADEFVVLTDRDDILTDEDLQSKKLVPVRSVVEKTTIAQKKNTLIKASNLDWVLFLNEGETIGENDAVKLIEMTKEKETSLYYLNVAPENTDPQGIIITSRYEPRLFRRSEKTAFDEVIFDGVDFEGNAKFSDISILKDGTYNTENPDFKSDMSSYHDELTHSPKNFYARFMLGKMFYIGKEIEKAAAEFELAKSCAGEIKDKNIGFLNENLYLLGCAYIGMKRPVKARETFKAIIKSDPDFLDAYFQLGYISCFNNEDPKAGIEYFEKYFSLLGNLKSAKKRALASLSTTDAGFKAFYYHGVLCQKTEELDKAEESFKKAIKANPEYVHSYINLASISLNKDDSKTAKEYLKKAAEIDDNNYATHHQLAILCIKEKNYTEAEAELNKCLEISKDSIESLSLLGRIYEEMKNFDKAEQCYRNIVDKQPQDKNSILKLGDILLKKEDPQAALRVFRDLLAMQPSFVPANVSVGSVLMQMDKLDQAETHFNDLMKKYSDVAEYVLYASKVAILKKNFGDALIYFDKLVEINPKSKGYVEEQKKQLKEKGII